MSVMVMVDVCDGRAMVHRPYWFLAGEMKLCGGKAARASNARRKDL